MHAFLNPLNIHFYLILFCDNDNHEIVKIEFDFFNLKTTLII